MINLPPWANQPTTIIGSASLPNLPIVEAPFSPKDSARWAADASDSNNRSRTLFGSCISKQTWWGFFRDRNGIFFRGPSAFPVMRCQSICLFSKTSTTPGLRPVLPPLSNTGEAADESWAYIGGQVGRIFSRAASTLSRRGASSSLWLELGFSNPCLMTPAKSRTDTSHFCRAESRYCVEERREHSI